MRALYAFAALCMACVPKPSELTPIEALSTFLGALEQSTHAPEQQKIAYGFVDLESQAVLQKRADTAASLGGQKLKAWDMLVPGRLSFAAQPVVSTSMRAHIDGDHATVEVPRDGESKLEVAMVREEGRWRVVLGLRD